MMKSSLAKRLIPLGMVFFILCSSSCSSQKGNVPSNSENDTNEPVVQEPVPEVPAVDYNAEFLKLVEEMSPIVAWNCEPGENESFLSDAVSGVPAALVNGASFTKGYSGNGIVTSSMNGSYLDIGTGKLGSLLSGKDAITVSMWVMPYNNYNSTNYRLFSLPIDGGKGGFQVHYQSTGVKVSGRSISTEGLLSKTFEYKLKNPALGTMAKYSNEGQWQHLVVTLNFEKKQILFYVNGTRIIGEGNESFFSDTFQLGNPSESECIGGAPQSNVYSFNGVMDNIFIFDRALSGKEVSSLYMQPGVDDSPIIDEVLLQSLIERMGDDIALYSGCSNLIQGGMVHPVDASDFSAAPLIDNGRFLIPESAAKAYFPVREHISTVELNGRSYLSLQQLCEANGKFLLEYGDVAMVLSSADKFQKDTDAPLLDRIALFFESPSATLEFSEWELSRTVVSQKGDLKGAIRGCASPSIAKIGNTIYASMDSNARQVYVFASEDNGKSYDFRSKIDNFKFASLFTLNNELYLLGVEVDGDVGRYAAITKSTDGGRTWSKITPNSGRLPQSSDGFAALSSSTAVLIANGRVYKAYSGQAINGKSFSWRKGCSCYIESAPVTSDLLNPANWTVSNSVSFDTNTYLSHPNASDVPTYVYCQEGNMVLAKDGSVRAIYRVDSVPIPGYAIMLKLSDDGKVLTYDRTSPDSMLSFEGGITKCTIRYDETSGKYLAFVNNITDGRSWAQRNVLSLAVSDDLVNWRLCKTILVDRSFMNDYISITRHAFQYVDWIVDGDDIIFTVREAMGDSENYHNANYLTFYRLSDYRELICDS